MLLQNNIRYVNSLKELAHSDLTIEAIVDSLALHMAQLPTKALGLTKKLLNASFNNTLEQQLALESKLQIQAANSNDYKEGVSAFVEKRKPNFKGN